MMAVTVEYQVSFGKGPVPPLGTATSSPLRKTGQPPREQPASSL
jgi:hypothetical protein